MNTQRILTAIMYIGFGTALFAAGIATAVTFQPQGRGDINLDGRINREDSTILFDNWDDGDTPIVGDLNYDGNVDDLDMSIMLGNWTGGKKPAAATKIDASLLRSY